MNAITLDELFPLTWPEPLDFSRRVARIGSQIFETPEAVQRCCQAVQRYQQELQAGQVSVELLHPLISLFQEVSHPAGVTVVREQGVPALRRLFGNLRNSEPLRPDDLLFVLKLLTVFADAHSSPDLLIEAMQTGLASDSYVWGTIFEHLTAEHPWTTAVLQCVQASPPDDFCGVCALDLFNELGGAHVKPHPFDTPTGRARLVRWLESDEPDDESYAVSAAMTLSHLSSSPDRSTLASLALNHDSDEVRIHGAEFAVREGQAAGLEILRDLAGIPPCSRRACDLLRQLGHASLIPEECAHPDFVALVEMCDWLTDWDNFGEVPDEIELYAKKRIFWPPTGDEREFRFFRYVFESDCDGAREEDNEVGVGLVGSQTCSLVGHTSPDMPLEDILALHCCWELQQAQDQRAPGLLSVEEGRKLLYSAES